MKQGLKLTLLASLLATGATLGITKAIACEAWVSPTGECPTQVYRIRHRNENPDNTGQL